MSTRRLGGSRGFAPKNSVLTEVLREKLFLELSLGPDIVQAPSDVISAYLIQLALYGRVTILNGRTVILDTYTWLELLKWIYLRVDGAPVQTINRNDDPTDDEKPPQKILYIPDNGRSNER